jgi:hypothetical protein
MRGRRIVGQRVNLPSQLYGTSLFRPEFFGAAGRWCPHDCQGRNPRGGYPGEGVRPLAARHPGQNSAAPPHSGPGVRTWPVVIAASRWCAEHVSGAPRPKPLCGVGRGGVPHHNGDQLAMMIVLERMAETSSAHRPGRTRLFQWLAPSTHPSTHTTLATARQLCREGESLRSRSEPAAGRFAGLGRQEGFKAPTYQGGLSPSSPWCPTKSTWRGIQATLVGTRQPIWRISSPSATARNR